MTSIISSLGAGAGIDSASLVTNLVSASFDPKTKILDTKETANTAKISSLATLSNGIDAFSTALSSLISSGSLRTQPSTSNSAILTATSKAGAQIGNLSAQLEIKQLAQAQSLYSTSLASASATVGQGKITLAAGGQSAEIVIDSSNDSLSGLARAINAAGIGVTASIITDTNGARLTLKGATGAAQAFTLTPDAGNATTDLARFAYGNGQTGGMTQAQEAKDAILKLDGVEVTRATNIVDDLIDGVSLNLVSAQPGTLVTLGATRPTEAIAQAVSDFVDAYNELKGQIDAATVSAATSSDGTAGALYGNSNIRDMQRQLSKLTSTVLSTAGSVKTLADIGVKTNRNGTLTLDKATLTARMASDPDGVEAMFNPSQRSSDPLVKISSAYGAAKPGTYQLTNLVAAAPGTPASGTIAGTAAVTTGSKLYASVTSPASGLVLEPQGNVASATITVDLGIGGALKSIRDSLRANNGMLSSLSSQLTTEKKSITDQRTKLSTQSDAYKQRLTKSFTAMDTRVAAYKATQAYLEQQVKVWTKDS